MNNYSKISKLSKFSMVNDYLIVQETKNLISFNIESICSLNIGVFQFTKFLKKLMLLIY